MYNLIVILAIIVSIALIFIVLIQKPKGGGISSNFSAANQIMGVKKTNDFVEKATWGLAIALLFLTLVSNLVVPGTKSSDVEKSGVEDVNLDIPNIPNTAPEPNNAQNGNNGDVPVGTP
ncbi:MAG: preprotein translocase subunit SecG [Flavobacteriales bacterium]|nr:preprotein translocase subunit SecG [Flavobacteriales bacterium]